MDTTKIALKWNFILILGFIVLAITGKLNETSLSLTNIIEENPLPKFYFPIFFIIGVLIPLALRLLHNNRLFIKSIIDPYLILLFSQIITEIALVLYVGKGSAVIVGFAFTFIRLLQLKKLLYLSRGSNLICAFLYFQLVFWSFNILQIIFQ